MTQTTEPVAFVIAEQIDQQFLVLSAPRSPWPTREAADQELIRSRGHGLSHAFKVYGLVELADA